MVPGGENGSVRSGGGGGKKVAGNGSGGHVGWFSLEAKRCRYHDSIIIDGQMENGSSTRGARCSLGEPLSRSDPVVELLAAEQNLRCLFSDMTVENA